MPVLKNCSYSISYKLWIFVLLSVIFELLLVGLLTAIAIERYTISNRIHTRQNRNSFLALNIASLVVVAISIVISIPTFVFYDCSISLYSFFLSSFGYKYRRVFSHILLRRYHNLQCSIELLSQCMHRLYSCHNIRRQLTTSLIVATAVSYLGYIMFACTLLVQVANPTLLYKSCVSFDVSSDDISILWLLDFALFFLSFFIWIQIPKSIFPYTTAQIPQPAVLNIITIPMYARLHKQRCKSCRVLPSWWYIPNRMHKIVQEDNVC
jgi:hypothetical protein